jgi:two-component system response regulator GlrR
MEQAKILSLDFAASGETSDLLREVLSPSYSFRHVAVGRAGFHGDENALSRDVVCFNPDMIFVALPNSLLEQGKALFQAIKAELPETPSIFVVEGVEPGGMFELLRLGVADFIIPPLKATDILPRVWRLLDHARARQSAPQRIKERVALRHLVSESPAFLAELKKVPLVAKCDASVLISGETGTGKEVFARAIHYLSPRARRPFVPVNCGAIPVELLENELFGHERGAYTGASTAQPGLLQEAEGGTIFLDEIDCLPLLAQIKILRFIQEKEFRPLGSTRTCSADVRVVGASNVDLEEAVKEGKLRKDLYYRLNVIRLALPPLRERRDDISLLARFFLNKYAAEFDKEVGDIPADAMQTLVLYDWPGNVRELEHVIERAVVLSEQGCLKSSDIFTSCQQHVPSEETFQQAKRKIVNQFEKAYIQRLLLAYQGNISRAAQAAKKNRRAFWQLIRKHQIDVQSFRPGARETAG